MHFWHPTEVDDLIGPSDFQVLVMFRYNPAPIRYSDSPQSDIYKTFHGDIRGEMRHVGSEDTADIRSHGGYGGCSERLGTCTQEI